MEFLVEYLNNTPNFSSVVLYIECITSWAKRFSGSLMFSSDFCRLHHSAGLRSKPCLYYQSQREWFRCNRQFSNRGNWSKLGPTIICNYGGGRTRSHTSSAYLCLEAAGRCGVNGCTIICGEEEEWLILCGCECASVSLWVFSCFRSQSSIINEDVLNGEQVKWESSGSQSVHIMVKWEAEKKGNCGERWGET